MEAIVNDGAYKMYDTHSLYGYLESKSTVEALQKAQPGRRGFVLSRSTFANSGAYVAHWLGDNVAKWEHLQHSIIGMLELSMFGIAHTGPDICGFIGTPTVELCKRWMQAGAFYPYSRNHNDIQSPPQDPGYFGPDVAVPSREYMTIRYRILPYMYSLFYKANTQGTTVARPMFFEYPTDPATWPLDKQFMLGNAFLVAPIVDQGQAHPLVYMPHGFWYQWTAGSVQHYDKCDKPTGEYVTVDVDGPALLQRDGTVVPTQALNDGNIVSTKFTRVQPFQLTVVPGCADKQASGVLFWDDGDAIDTVKTGAYLEVGYASKLDSSKAVLTATVQHKAADGKLGSDLPYSAVTFVNFPSEPKTVTLDCWASDDGSLTACPTMNTTYNGQTKMLTIAFGTDKQALPITQAFTLTASLV
jgi:alpha-glucosidase (family GH31 glycosyl hydrolase)